MEEQTGMVDEGQIKVNNSEARAIFTNEGDAAESVDGEEDVKLSDARKDDELQELRDLEDEVSDAEEEVDRAKARLKTAKEIFDGRVARLREAIRRTAEPAEEPSQLELPIGLDTSTPEPVTSIEESGNTSLPENPAEQEAAARVSTEGHRTGSPATKTKRNGRPHIRSSSSWRISRTSRRQTRVGGCRRRRRISTCSPRTK